MVIVINGEKVSLEDQNLNIMELLNIQNVDSPDMVSVQINGEFIEKDVYSSKFIQDNDEVDFLYFMGGGR